MLEIRDIFLFKQWKRGRYIRSFMSASLYKSGENTEMYAHIVSSWLQLIYIFWVFYIRILSICHKFIDSNIYERFIPCGLCYCLQGNTHNRVVPRGTKAHLVNPYQFILAVWKAIISREPAQGIPSPIGSIPSIFLLDARQYYQEIWPKGH